MSADLDPIDLARTAALKLGGLEARPSTCEILGPAGREILQPRIMQVLVALAGVNGEVVSRDDLIRRCWEGRSVGDDAINRCIARLRQLGGAHGAFTIETIARVGYRLSATPGVHEGEIPNRTAEAPQIVLAVLPFDNHSNDSDLQYFSDGVSEEILSAVVRIAGVRVIGSSSSFSFRGARKVEAASALRATHLIDGSVRRSGTRLRIAAQLIEAGGGTVLWNEHYDREVSDALVLQDEIAALTASALSMHLAPAAPKPTLDPQALDLYLRALSARRRFDLSAQEKAIAYLQAALAIEPDFARAHAALALGLCTRILATTVVSSPSDAFDIACGAVERAARQALTLEPDNPEARFALLSLKPAIGAWQEHETALNAALAAAPSDPALIAAKGRFLFGVGCTREAYQCYASAFASDPLSPRAMAYEGLRRVSMLDDKEGARSLSDRAYALASSDPIVWRLRTVTLNWCGDYDETLAMLDSGVHVGQTPERLAIMREGILFWKSNRPRSENPTLTHAPRMLAENPFLLGPMVFSMVVSADFYDEAMDLIDDAMTRFPLHKLWSQWNTEGLNIAPTVAFFNRRSAGVRAHPRFLPLCARIGLCTYWSKTGRWPDFIVDASNRNDLEATVRALG